MTRYPFEVKLRAVELFNAGWSPADIAVECELRSTMSAYSWAQRHREEGEWGLMSKKNVMRAPAYPLEQQSRNHYPIILQN